MPATWWPGCAVWPISRSRWRPTRRCIRRRSDAGADLDNLKRKLDAGAARAITQYFFDADVFLRFLDRCLAAGITAPIVPGIMPVSNFAQAQKFSDACGASVPDWMTRLFEGTEDDPETRRMVGTVIAAEQVRRAAGQRGGRVPLLSR